MKPEETEWIRGLAHDIEFREVIIGPAVEVDGELHFHIATKDRVYKLLLSKEECQVLARCFERKDTVLVPMRVQEAMWAAKSDKEKADCPTSEGCEPESDNQRPPSGQR